MRRLIGILIAACVLAGARGLGQAAASGGLALDGVDDYVTFGVASPLGTPTFTLETWFNWTGRGVVITTGRLGIDGIPLLAKGRGEFDGDNRDMNFFLGIRPADGVLVADFEEATNSPQPGLNHPVAGVTRITSNAWHHAAATYDGTNWQLFLDGALEATLLVDARPQAASIQHASLGTALTSLGEPGGFFSGVLDEARVWNYPRTATDIAGGMRLQIPAAPGLLGRWSLDEISGPLAQDSAGQGVHGTWMNSPTPATGYPFGSGSYVVLTSPGDQAAFAAPASILMEAAAVDPDGVQRVEFCRDNQKLGEATSPPYTYTWNGVLPGDYLLRAVAVDAGGTSTTSAVVRVSVRFQGAVTTNTLVAFGSIWKYSDTGTDLGAAWLAPGYDDRAWPEGAAQLGFGDGDEITPVARVNGGGTTNITIYFRRAFLATGVSTYTNLTLRLLRDDGGVVYLNGSEIFRSPTMPAGLISYGTFSGSAPDNTVDTNDATAALGWLNEGTNVLAVEIHQSDLGSSDISFDLQLVGITGVPRSNAPPRVQLTSPTDGALFNWPAPLNLSALATDADGEIARVWFLTNGLFLGEDTASPFSLSWNNAAPGQYVLTALAIDNAGASATSAPVNISIVINPAPSVAITYPAPGSTFAAPTNLLVQASATDSNGLVTLVELFRDGLKLGEAPTAPYTFNWTNRAAGTYVLLAVATDNLGARATSAPVQLTFTGAPNTAPTVALTFPTNQALLPAPTNLWVEVAASDLEGAVQRVELLANGVKLGEDTSAPYTFAWSNAVLGTFVLTAVASDDLGARGTSAPVTVTFFGQAPTVLVSTGAVWKYFDRGENLGTAWREPGYDDSGWTNGPAELGYGDAAQGRPEATVVSFGSNPNAKPITTYFRRAFVVGDPSLFSFLTVRLLRDDGGVVYLNGAEVFRHNFPAGTTTISFDTRAANASDDGTLFFTNQIPSSLLVPGTNVIAVEIHQDQPGSSDISFELELIGNTGALLNRPPTATIASPSDGATFTDPAVVTIIATAVDADGTVSRVEFYANSAKIGEDTSSPFGLAWSSMGTGEFALQAVAYDNFGFPGTSAVVRLQVVLPNPPTLAAVAPLPGIVRDLAQITVTFSEPVSGVSADDLLVNGVPARGVSGSNAVYTFTLAPLDEGPALMTWSAACAIFDFENPPKPFDPTVPEASWQYRVVDTTAPTARAEPVPGATVPRLTEVEVTFSEPVGGVTAADLLINGLPASSVSGSGAGPYRFRFGQPDSGLVQMTWASGHGIGDLALARHAFAGGAWTYTLDTMTTGSSIVINELMFHPSPESTATEYIELFNRGPSEVNLSGWRFSRGVSFAFPNMSLGAGAYLVVVANRAAFQAKYPSVTNVLGDWQGTLSNVREEIELENALGDTVDRIAYADEGDWAVRVQALVGGAPGWLWRAEADGQGKSMELANPALRRDTGQNWRPSGPVHGTPGAVNSTATNDLAPLILGLAHFPAAPQSTEEIAITARIVDEVASGLTVMAQYRNASTLTPPAFTSVVMVDDGEHLDGASGDGIFGAVLPKQTNRTVIEFYVQAADATGLTRTWPAPAQLIDGTLAQAANALLQVDDEAYPGSQPIVRVVLTETERNRLAGMDRGSNAEINGTLVSLDGTGTDVRYNVGLRFRGASSRNRNPPSYRCNIPADRPWHEQTEINLNSQYGYSQLIGASLAAKIGLPAAALRAIQFRLNGENLAAGYGEVTFNSYVLQEAMNRDWAERVFPHDGGGNVYRCARPDTGLHYLGANPPSYAGRGYSKESNVSENDWTDLITLTWVLNHIADHDEYARRVREVVNVEKWMLYFAACQLMEYSETSLCNGGNQNGMGLAVGDDYSMYRGADDPRFMLMPHDFDTIFNLGDTRGSITENVFQMTTLPALNRFMKHPDFTPIYYRTLKLLADTAFAPEQLNPFLDELLGGAGYVPTTTIDAVKAWAAQRHTNVLSQIPLALTISPPALNQQGGYFFTSQPTLDLSGQANGLETRAVRVNGVAATWEAWQRTWSIAGLPLRPGLNRVVVQALDFGGRRIDSQALDVWYDDGSLAQAPATISSDTTWTAAGGPHVIHGVVTVAAGVTLTLEPGATVYLGPGASLTVNGRLLAEGTAERRIRFTRQPGTSGAWAGLRFVNSPVEQRLTFADLEFGGQGGAANVAAENAAIHLENVTFAHTLSQLLRLTNSSVTLLYSILPSIAGNALISFNGMPAHGHALIQGNLFGTPGVPATTSGHDVIDFTGGNQPGPIVEFIDNLFTSAVDDAIDLDSTDALIEGNLFLHVHQDAPRADAAYAISTGRVNAHTSELTLARNFFYDVDHALLLADAASAVLQHNTIARVRTNAPASALASVISFSEPARGTAGGAGVVMEGNILWDVDGRIYQHFTNGVMVSRADFNVIPGTNWPGVGNLQADPLFVAASLTNLTHLNLVEALALQPSSPARGAGPKGLDLGALVPAGPSLSGEPVSPSGQTSATLRVGGPGLTHYRYRVNEGAWSGERAIAEPIALTGLSDGAYRVDVLGKNAAGTWQNTNAPTASRTWIVNARLPTVRLSEVLARNDRAVPVGGRYPDLVELHNDGSAPLNLGGMGLTDERDAPYKFRFPLDLMLHPGEFLVLYGDSQVTPPGLHLGFALKGDGDELYLFSAGGRLLDAVEFGPQLADYSIGRLPDGSWTLTQPTLGSANVRHPTGDPFKLRLNEWLTDGVSDDFIEVFNLDPLPVALSGCFLTDNIPGYPNRNAIRALSFIDGGGFTAFRADGNTAAGPEHLNFELAPEQGTIGLFSPALQLIDCVAYGPQRTGVSEGRSPNGTPTHRFFDPPTPGSPNPVAQPAGSQVVLNEILTDNISRQELDGTRPDWVELFNPTTNALSLADLSLTDDPALPRRYVFPAGTSLRPLGFHVVRCDPTQPASATNTGFGLKADGGGVYLYDSPARSSAQLSAVPYGLQAADYALGCVPDGSTNWVLTLPTRGAANLAQALGNPSLLRLNEWMAYPASGEDWFEVFNADTLPVALGGLHVTDDLGNRLKHRIAPRSFLGVGAFAFRQFFADNDVNAGPDHVRFRLAAEREALGIAHTNGWPIDEITFEDQALGVSEGRLPDGGSTVVPFPTSMSPGEPNYLPLGNVVINEVLSHSHPPLEDAVELFNTSASPVNIGGWYLSDTRSDLKRYRIAANTVLPGGGFKVFYETDLNPDPGRLPGFSLNSAQGDELYLAQADAAGALTGFRAQVKFGAAESGVSFGRHLTSQGEAHFVALRARTFGIDAADTVEEFRAGAGLPNAAPLVGPVVFSELMYHPPDGPDGSDNVAEEYVELVNISSLPVRLHDPTHPTNTWRLRGGVEFDFPAGLELAPGGTLLVVSFDPAGNPSALAAFAARYGLAPGALIAGPYAGKLDNGGETLELFKPDAPQPSPDPDAGHVPYILVERIRYSDAPPWPAGADGDGAALARANVTEYGNDPANWTAEAPSPGPTLPRLTVTPGYPGALIRFRAQANATYTVQYADGLGNGTWHRLVDVPAPPVTTNIMYVDETAHGARFYRLRSPRVP
jgi:hypothetical protein